ncbi:diaminopimelate decarboxylase [Desulfovermiculus halophilus]|uniref:diaminopimelate decarboxylase n=1 Tax=Desulfovermiculus halophilus TaxID=339722 RepID=UPI000483B22A|nr:diaminopimelate decarboxylase [Desulfovermiculus halophilus]
MHHFQERNGELWAEEVRVADLAREYGTPLYVYSTATLTRHFQAFDSAFSQLPHLTCFSLKSNSNLHVLKLLKELGAGADIVSGGELHRALMAGMDPKQIVFSGVGKQEFEMQAALAADILMFNVESAQELETLSRLAGEMNTTARISLRINPDVDPKTHPYISTGLKKNKFGIQMSHALELYARARDLPGIEPVGIDCHIGSQLTQVSPFLDALDRLMALRSQLVDMGLNIKYLDIGGGLGITYGEEEPPHPSELGQALSHALQNEDLTLILEPGRVIAGNAGILVSRVLACKSTDDKNFAVVDAAMNDLLRPSLYSAYHRIAEVRANRRPEQTVDVVGPICETGDFLAKDRILPGLQADDLIAVFSAGAYGFTMSSQYNSRPRAAEVLVDKDRARLIRHRETFADLLRLEENV